jgi:hypothetical protein
MPDLQTMLDVSTQTIRRYNSAVFGSNTVEGQHPWVDGSGVTVAVLDTGVDDGEHESLPSWKFVGGADCVTGTGCTTGNPDDDQGHGTHVASTAIGVGDMETRRGVADGAELVDVKVLDSRGWSVGNSVLEGMELVLDQRRAWGIDVVNMSLGACRTSDGSDVLSQMVNRMVFEGIATVVAIGNTSNCGLSDNAVFVNAPGAADDAITVANFDDVDTVAWGDDSIWRTSINGPRTDDGDADARDELKPDLAGPGTDIEAARWDTVDEYRELTGTSMATPHVAGCAALLLEVDPLLRPSSLKELLIDTSDDRGDPGWDGGKGHGYLDCFQAVETLINDRRTDLGFEVYEHRPGSPTWWRSPEVQPRNPRVREGVTNFVDVEVANLGAQVASGFVVKVGIYNFSNSDADYPICTIEVTDPLMPGDRTTVSCEYTPEVSGAPPGQVHACLKAEVVYAFDTDYQNNRAQHNVNVEQAYSPARFAFGVSNPTDFTQQLDIVPSYPEGEPKGWKLELDQEQVVLAPDDCPVTIEAIFEPIDADAQRRAEVDLAVLGEQIGEEEDYGGVTLMAQLSCAPTDLSFPRAENKDYFTWVRAIYDACPQLFDVARGSLPIDAATYGDPSCLADDDGVDEFEDGDRPAPGDGFYYLVRAGSNDPGSWASSRSSERRDDGLAVCE